MRRWIPFISSGEQTEQEPTEEKEEDEENPDDPEIQPGLRELFTRENIADVKAELQHMWEEDEEQVHFLAFAAGVAGGYILLLYLFDGWVPLYIIAGYLILMFAGLRYWFEDALGEVPYNESES